MGKFIPARRAQFKKPFSNAFDRKTLSSFAAGNARFGGVQSEGTQSGDAPAGGPEARRRAVRLPTWAKLAAAGLLVGTLAGCSQSNPNQGEVALVQGFAGLVAADEPNAALVGRDVLARNGTAFDATVAMAFTLAVTQPSRAGLGGGGACLVFSRQEMNAQALLFAPQAGPGGGVVPETPRAMALLHARYGTQRWERLMNPAEQMARFGFPVSRAFVKDLQASRVLLDGNPALARIFRKPNGDDYQVGDRLKQPYLSTALSGLRQRGGGYLYQGDFARRLVAEAQSAGVAFTEEEIRNNLPELVAPLELKVGNHALFLPPPPVTGGAGFAQLWNSLVEVKGWDGGAQQGYQAFVQAQDQIFAARASAPQAVPGTNSQAVPATGFVVGDRFGNAVTCSFTLNQFFGSAQVLPGSGLVLAAAPPQPLGNDLPLSMALVGNKNTGRVTFAASGGASAGTSASLFTVAFARLEQDRPLEEALALPRVRVTAAGDLLYEPGVSVDALGEAGRKSREVPDSDRVSAFVCPYSLEGEQGFACQASVDPRSDGLAVIAR